jgi:hypothetical protein
VASNDPRLKTPLRKRLVAELRAQHRDCEMPTCLLPTREIDYTAGRYTPASFCADEIIARWLGGDPLNPTNLRPAHWRCNASAGGHAAAAIRGHNTPQPATSRRWW